MRLVGVVWEIGARFWAAHDSRRLVVRSRSVLGGLERAEPNSCLPVFATQREKNVKKRNVSK